MPRRLRYGERRMNDLVVVGGGQAGLAAAAHAAERGPARRRVREDRPLRRLGRASRPGSCGPRPTSRRCARWCRTAIRSSGGCWSMGSSRPSTACATRACTVTERWYGQMGFGVAYRTDIHALHDHWQRVIVSRRGRAAAEHAGALAAVRRRSRGGRRGRRGARGAARDRRLPGRLRARQALPGLGRRPDADPLEPAAARATASGSPRRRARRPAAGSAASTGIWCRTR